MICGAERRRVTRAEQGGLTGKATGIEHRGGNRWLDPTEQAIEICGGLVCEHRPSKEPPFAAVEPRIERPVSVLGDGGLGHERGFVGERARQSNTTPAVHYG